MEYLTQQLPEKAFFSLECKRVVITYYTLGPVLDTGAAETKETHCSRD